MASTVSTATLPTTRRRQDSSDDFGGGSLGSIAGSAVGSSVEEETSSHQHHHHHPLHEATTTTTITTATATEPTLGVAAAATPSSVASAVLPVTTAVPPVPTTILPPLSTTLTTPKSTATIDGFEEISSPTSTKGSGGGGILTPTNTIRPAIKRKGSVDFTLSIDDEASFSAGPLKKRKASVDFTLAIDDDHDNNMLNSEGGSGGGESSFARGVLPKLDALPSMEAINSLESIHGNSSHIRGSASVASSHTHLGQAISALDHLDALGEEAGAAAAKVKREFKPRGQSMDSTGSNGTFTSNSQRMLLEAFMGYGHESSSSSYARRDRLESWGGMSDLSVTGLDHGSHSFGNPDSTTAAALACLADDIAAAANFGGSDNNSMSSLLAGGEDSKVGSIPSKICVDSVAESDPSAALLQVPAAETDLSSDLQAFVKAAMASVGTQLAEIATAVESAGKKPNGPETPAKDPDADNSDMSSVASLLIGATSDTGSKVGSLSLESRPQALSVTSALNISVDYDAVAAAVSAAEAAAGELDLSAIGTIPIPKSSASVSSGGSKSKSLRRRQQLPTKNKRKNSDATASSTGSKKAAISGPLHVTLPPIPKPKLEGRDMEEIRERARAAAGYVPPSSPNDAKSRPLPPKKRAKRPTPDPQTPDQRVTANDSFMTPRTSNVGTARTPASASYLSSATSPASSAKASSSATKGQSGQKWDSMFDALVAFIAERKDEETIGMSDKEKEEWAWDGNVPTTFKSKDGKALGRWVNNQRSAKSKGVLKDDREDRLVKAGLKWSVLASNSWNEMLEELRVYVNEQTKAGRSWDGNVPTNYRIKTKSGSKLSDEDKNLGRWVNRQRSLFQAGKLRKDRQLALEKVGLKWSMLATTSWESMFDTLCDYVKIKTAEGAEWDGNVPANYRTNDNPPRALGRWINRQRSAYVKDKLKAEYVDKLNAIGLKWSVHERRPLTGDLVTSSEAGKRDGYSDGEDNDDDDYLDGEEAVPDRQPSSNATVPGKQPSSIAAASTPKQNLARPVIGSKEEAKTTPKTKKAAATETMNSTPKIKQEPVTTEASKSASKAKMEPSLAATESKTKLKTAEPAPAITEQAKSAVKVQKQSAPTQEAKTTPKPQERPAPVATTKAVKNTLKTETEPTATATESNSTATAQKEPAPVTTDSKTSPTAQKEPTPTATEESKGVSKAQKEPTPTTTECKSIGTVKKEPAPARIEVAKNTSKAQKEPTPVTTESNTTTAEKEPTPTATEESKGVSKAQQEPAPARIEVAENTSKAQKQPVPATTESKATSTAQKEPNPKETEDSKGVSKAQKEPKPTTTEGKSIGTVEKEPAPAKTESTSNGAIKKEAVSAQAESTNTSTGKKKLSPARTLSEITSTVKKGPAAAATEESKKSAIVPNESVPAATEEPESASIAQKEPGPTATESRSTSTATTVPVPSKTDELKDTSKAQKDEPATKNDPKIAPKTQKDESEADKTQGKKSSEMTNSV